MKSNTRGSLVVSEDLEGVSQELLQELLRSRVLEMQKLHDVVIGFLQNNDTDTGRKAQRLLERIVEEIAGVWPPAQALPSPESVPNFMIRKVCF